MKDEPAVIAAIDRLAKIEFRHGIGGSGSGRAGSSVALMREHLRRSAVVAQALGRSDSAPWFDAAALLSLPDVDSRFLPGYVFLDPEPEYRGPGADLLEDRVIDLKRLLSSRAETLSLEMSRSCLWHLRWEAVKSHPALAPLNLPDLYEPLIVLYERGGWFRMEHGYIDLEHTMIGPGTVAGRLGTTPLRSLDPAALDLRDAAWEQDRQKRRDEQARKTP